MVVYFHQLKVIEIDELECAPLIWPLLNKGLYIYYILYNITDHMCQSVIW